MKAKTIRENANRRARSENAELKSAVARPLLWVVNCPHCATENDVEATRVNCCSLEGVEVIVVCEKCGKEFQMNIELSKI